MTEVLLQYLKDYRQALLNDHLAAWEAGTADDKVEAERRGRTLILYEMAELPLEAIQAFYANQEEPDAAQDPENHDR